ncbi:hypothetical protein Tco_1029880 [Tanacetum coccineum]|uniref:Uncharacterized protein n=1 Tax=Tanacetum coccineum TaxID=301880 RepID=A0ABQ5G6D5_9ASTR
MIGQSLAFDDPPSDCRCLSQSNNWRLRGDDSFRGMLRGLDRGYFPLIRINLDLDMDKLFGTREYYASQGLGQGSGGNQDYYKSQDYSMGHSLAHRLALVEDDSPIKEAAPIKAKKVSKCRQKAKMTYNQCRTIGGEYSLFDFFKVNETSSVLQALTFSLFKL